MKHKLTGGYSISLDRYYDLSVEAEPDGSISIREDYDYPARGSIEGREYSYSLKISSDSVPQFLLMLSRKANETEDLSQHTDRFEALVRIFQSLLEQGQLTGYETARAKENRDRLVEWLDQEGIIYKKDSFSWFSFLDDE